MLATILPKQALSRQHILHDAECGNDLNTAEKHATASMLRAGGRLIPSDTHDTLDKLSEPYRTADMTVVKQDGMFRTVRHGCPIFDVCVL
jgi:hypothetical protein